jgi:hypothetical protein
LKGVSGDAAAAPPNLVSPVRDCQLQPHPREGRINSPRHPSTSIHLLLLSYQSKVVRAHLLTGPVERYSHHFGFVPYHSRHTSFKIELFLPDSTTLSLVFLGRYL